MDSSIKREGEVMAYLLRTKEDYRLFYGKPENKYVLGSTGMFSVGAYSELVNEEREIECHHELMDNSVVLDGWADVCQNDYGIVISIDIAEYLLEGDALDVDTFLEVSSI